MARLPAWRLPPERERFMYLSPAGETHALTSLVNISRSERNASTLEDVCTRLVDRNLGEALGQVLFVAKTFFRLRRSGGAQSI